ncbi:MAG: PKD domain-containing protein, partial [Candidatus Dadabacteria bacterium]
MNLNRLGFALLLLLTCTLTFGQDFSNKGKEFWLAYCYHVGMVNGGGAPVMTLYITSDVNTPYKVEIYGGTIIQSGSITAGNVVTVNIPNTYFVNNEGKFTDRAIHVTSDQPIVVYSYITRSAASAATLCLPTPVLGKEYYASNFTQISNENNSNSYITIIAVEDNTTVEITPSANTKNGWLAGNTYPVNLNKGEIYQVLGTVNPGSGVFTGVDLSGTKIKSVASGATGCKRIAVFSGSGKIFITATSCNQNSSDNLYQQLYPVGSWGLKYLTVPSYSRLTNIYRIIRSDPTANVYLNGALIPSSSFVNNFYQFYNKVPNSIVSDKPISVAQYFTTQGCDGNQTPYDPDMIMLNPVEQNISKVTLVSSNLIATPTSAHQHHIHVVMRNGGTGMSSFKLDGLSIPLSSWQVHPSDPSYSYLYLNNVTQGYHTIQSDSGFNAIAYGYANAETYGYSAGSNVKDLYQFASIKNQYATVDFPAACRNSPFNFSMTFPYQPTQIQWKFNGLFADTIVNTPVYDSTWVINGKQLYRYTLPRAYSITNTSTFPATYPIKVLAQNPTPEGCSGEQEIDYDLKVYDRPVPDFTITASGCVSDSVKFTDISNTNGRNAYIWGWNYGDGSFMSGSQQNAQHLYTAAGTYPIKFSLITDIGCLSDTLQKSVTLSSPPVAKFGVYTPFCVGKSLSFSDSSSTTTSSITKWYWDFGDGTPVITATTGASQAHTFASTGIYSVKLKVENASGCQSTIFSKQVTVSSNPVSSFSFGNACLPSGNMQFTNLSTINDGTQAQLTYNWDFGDGGTTATSTNPSHVYTGTGPYDVKLSVTSNNGCATDTIKKVSTIYAQPQASFTAPADVCFGTQVSFTDGSTAPGSTVAQWAWNFGDGQASTQQSPTHTYASAGTFTVTLTITSAVGCSSAPMVKTLVVNSLPTANFNVAGPVCETKGISISDASKANSGTIVQWAWDLGDGTTTTNTTNAAVSHTYAAAGTYSITLQVKTDKGCLSSVYNNPLVVHPQPVPGFIMPGNCLADPFTQFTDTSTITDGTASKFTYQWNFDDKNATAANPNTSTIKNPQHKFSATGNYNVALTVTSTDGCISNITQVFTINGALPQSQYSVQGGNVQCSNKSVVVKNNSTVDFGNIVKLEIYWDYLNDPTNQSVIINPAVGGTYSHTYPEFFIPTTKDYTVKVVAYSGINCFNSTTQVVTMQATPQVIFNPLTYQCADGASFQITQA